ncbi:MAG: HAD-IA family hydrolase [Phycisphaerales bacterium]
MPSQDPIRCICFDAGGVIVRHWRSWDDACRATGIPVRDGHSAPERVAARRALHARYTVGTITCDDFYRELTAACHGLYDEQEVRALHHHWITSEYQGVGDIIRRLNQLPTIETALLSNTCHSHWERMLPGGQASRDFPSISLLRHKHASHLLGHAKPDEQIYRAFEQATGFLAGEILFFDDLPENVRAAEARGWRAELIDYTSETAPQISRCLTRHAVW